MRDGISDLVLDASIWYNYSGEGIRRCFKHDFIQVFHMLFDIRKTRMKRKLIWKNINNMISRFKFFVEKTKRREKFIMLIVNVNKRWFQLNSLFSYEVVNGHIMAFLFLWPIGTENTVNDMVRWKRRLS